MHRHLRVSRLTSCAIISCTAITELKGIAGVSLSHDVHVIPVSKAVGCKFTLACTQVMVSLTFVMILCGNLQFYSSEKQNFACIRTTLMTLRARPATPHYLHMKGAAHPVAVLEDKADVDAHLRWLPRLAGGRCWDAARPSVENLGSSQQAAGA